MEKENINPWLHIWVHPRKTLRSLLETNPKKTILWLAILAGIFTILTFATISWHPPRDAFHHFLLVLALMIVGGILGLFGLYFMGWLLSLTGKWIGGKGNFIDLKCAVGWSNYPFILSHLFSMLNFLAFPHLWFQTAFGLIGLIIFVWGFIIYMHLIGEAHQFSSWKGVLAFLIAFAIIFLIFMLLALIIPLLSPLFQ